MRQDKDLYLPVNISSNNNPFLTIDEIKHTLSDCNLNRLEADIMY